MTRSSQTDKPAQHYQLWHPRDDAYLAENYLKRDVKIIAEKLGRSVYAVRRRIVDLGLSRRIHSRPWRTYDLRFLREHFAEKGAQWCAALRVKSACGLAGNGGGRKMKMKRCAGCGAGNIQSKSSLRASAAVMRPLSCERAPLACASARKKQRKRDEHHGKARASILTLRAVSSYTTRALIA